MTIMVKINRVYTRAGYDRRTVLGDGAPCPKPDRRVAATVSVDEANALIGLACLHVGPETQSLLRRIQNDLFDVGADLCRPERSGLKAEPLRLAEAQVAWIEDVLDARNAELAPLDCSCCRAARRARRCSTSRGRSCGGRSARSSRSPSEPLTPALIPYMNRLSDLLFVLARIENDRGLGDIRWQPGLHTRDPETPV